jgi:hypothetical protein
MGNVTYGPPPEFVLALRDALGIDTFVETGTNQGNTSSWAAANFKEVHTVERSPVLYTRARDRLAAHPNVTIYNDDTRSFLSNLLGKIPTALFWLDAHWSGGETAGVDDECPLLAELAILAPTMDRSVLLIDDARLFEAPPPPPHKPEQWPNVDQVVEAAAVKHPIWWKLFDDIIVIAPRRVGDIAENLVAAHRKT